MAKNKQNKSPLPANNSLLNKNPIGSLPENKRQGLEALRANPPEDLKEAIQDIVLHHLESHYQGPIPSSKEMAGYKDVSPEIPQQIMSMALLHTKNLAETGPKLLKTALWMGYSLCLLMLCFSFYFAFLGNNTAAAGFGIAPLIILLRIIFQKLPSQ